MKRMTKRLLSFLLSVMMLMTMVPVSAFAAEPGESQPITDSGAPPQPEDGPKHWLQEYQEAALAQADAPRRVRAAFAGSVKPSYRMIHWTSGEENRLVFANGAYLASPMPRITLNGETAFCGEWNGKNPGGDYIQTGEGSDPAIKQILANFDNSGKSDADYAAAQAAIWAHLMGTSVVSWGACPGASSEDKIFRGTSDYSDIRYNYLNWGGGMQNLITYNTDPSTPPPYNPDDYPEDQYRIEVTTDTQTETEVRNQKSYSYSDGIGQLTIRKHDQDGRSLDGALFDIDVGATRS